ncbi:hypothetical protein [Kitasatospora sp. NPDC093102]|uniref:hypothetical protein n=1 Tax=Kitasatospora sp. NPDC093102 TaxID=3155069 RepID=UPI00343787B7
MAVSPVSWFAGVFDFGASGKDVPSCWAALMGAMSGGSYPKVDPPTLLSSAGALRRVASAVDEHSVSFERSMFGLSVTSPGAREMVSATAEGVGDSARGTARSLREGAGALEEQALQVDYAQWSMRCTAVMTLWMVAQLMWAAAATAGASAALIPGVLAGGRRSVMDIVRDLLAGVRASARSGAVFGAGQDALIQAVEQGQYRHRFDLTSLWLAGLSGLAGGLGDPVGRGLGDKVAAPELLRKLAGGALGGVAGGEAGAVVSAAWEGQWDPSMFGLAAAAGAGTGLIGGALHHYTQIKHAMNQGLAQDPPPPREGHQPAPDPHGRHLPVELPPPPSEAASDRKAPEHAAGTGAPETLHQPELVRPTMTFENPYPPHDPRSRIPDWAEIVRRAQEDPRVREVSGLTPEQLHSWWTLLPKEQQQQLSSMVNNVVSAPKQLNLRVNPTETLRLRAAFVGELSVQRARHLDTSISVEHLLNAHRGSGAPHPATYTTADRDVFHHVAGRQATAADRLRFGLPSGAPDQGDPVRLPSPGNGGSSSAAGPSSSRQEHTSEGVQHQPATTSPPSAPPSGKRPFPSRSVSPATAALDPEPPKRSRVDTEGTAHRPPVPAAPGGPRADTELSALARRLKVQGVADCPKGTVNELLRLTLRIPPETPISTEHRRRLRQAGELTLDHFSRSAPLQGGTQSLTVALLRQADKLNSLAAHEHAGSWRDGGLNYARALSHLRLPITADNLRALGTVLGEAPPSSHRKPAVAGDHLEVLDRLAALTGVDAKEQPPADADPRRTLVEDTARRLADEGHTAPLPQGPAVPTTTAQATGNASATADGQPTSVPTQSRSTPTVLDQEALGIAVKLMVDHGIPLPEPHLRESDPTVLDIAWSYAFSADSLKGTFGNEMAKSLAEAAAKTRAGELARSVSTGESHGTDLEMTDAATPAHDAVADSGTSGAPRQPDVVVWAVDSDRTAFGTLESSPDRAGIVTLTVPLIDVRVVHSTDRNAVLVPTEHGWHATDRSSGRTQWRELLGRLSDDTFAVQLPAHEPTDPETALLFANTRRELEKHLGVALFTAPPGSRLHRDAGGDLRIPPGLNWVGDLHGIRRRKGWFNLPSEVFTDQFGLLCVSGQTALRPGPAGLGFTGGARWNAAWQSVRPTSDEVLAITCDIAAESVHLPSTARFAVTWVETDLPNLLGALGVESDTPIQLLNGGWSKGPSETFLQHLTASLNRPLIVTDEASVWDQTAVHQGMIRAIGVNGHSQGRWRMILPRGHRLEGAHLWTEDSGEVRWPPEKIPQQDRTWTSLTTEQVTATVQDILREWLPREPGSQRNSSGELVRPQTRARPWRSEGTTPHDLTGPQLREELLAVLRAGLEENDPLALLDDQTIRQFNLTPPELAEASKAAFSEARDQVAQESYGDGTIMTDQHRHQAHEEQWRADLARRLSRTPEDIDQLKEAASHSRRADDLLKKTLQRLRTRLVEQYAAPSWLSSSENFLDASSDVGTAALKVVDLFDRHGIRGLMELERRLRGTLTGEPPLQPAPREAVGSATGERFIIQSSHTGTDSMVIYLGGMSEDSSAFILTRLDDGPGAMSAIRDAEDNVLDRRPLKWAGEPTVYIDLHGLPGRAIPALAEPLTGTADTTGGHLADLVAQRAAFIEMWHRHGGRLNVVLVMCFSAAVPEGAGSAADRTDRLVTAREFADRLEEHHHMPVKVYGAELQVSYSTELGVSLPEGASYDPAVIDWHLFAPTAGTEVKHAPSDDEDPMNVDGAPAPSATVLPPVDIGPIMQ